MKTMKLFLAVLVASLFTLNTMASGNLKVNFLAENKDLTAVEISNVKMSTYEIDVKNDKGEVVFYKETKAPATSYKRNYDFSRLEDGVYFFTVKIDNESTETKFEIKKGQINVIEEKKMVDPVFIFQNNELKMTYLNFSEKNTRLIVYDTSRKKIYEKDLKSNFVTQHGISFSKTPKGNYEVVLLSENEVHNYSLYID